MTSLTFSQMEISTGGKKVQDAVGCAFGVASMMFGFIGLGALTGGITFASAGAILSYTGGLYSVVKGCTPIEETTGGGVR